MEKTNCNYYTHQWIAKKMIRDIDVRNNVEIECKLCHITTYIPYEHLEDILK